LLYTLIVRAHNDLSLSVNFWLQILFQYWYIANQKDWRVPVHRNLFKILLCVAPVMVNSDALATDSVGGEPDSVTPALSQGLLPKNTGAETSMMAADPADQVASESTDQTDAIKADPIAGDTAVADSSDQVHDKEEIWSEISDAIASLNDVVGDEMFLDLRRKDGNQMEVRVDVGFWQRVRYQTRVDLKNDISNIWHLYVKQYHDGDFSAVHFVDDSTDKTIDIFTQSK
jgi:hypothetical protein